MREFDALRSLPSPITPRNVDERDIHSRIAASYRDREFFNGARKNGYGGLFDDGRWKPVAADLIADYTLTATSRVLQIGCELAFLLHQLELMGIRACGTETSRYAIEHADFPVMRAPCMRLPFRRQNFDLVLAIGPVYTLNLADAIACLREIERVGRGKSFITLGAYETREEFRLLSRWSLLGCTILKKDEWLAVLEHAGYRGDYKFITAKTLGLI
jgi:hypothetical protein